MNENICRIYKNLDGKSTPTWTDPNCMRLKINNQAQLNSEWLSFMNPNRKAVALKEREEQVKSKRNSYTPVKNPSKELAAMKTKMEEFEKQYQNFVNELTDYTWCDGIHHMRANGVTEVSLGMCPDYKATLAAERSAKVIPIRQRTLTYENYTGKATDITELKKFLTENSPHQTLIISGEIRQTEHLLKATLNQLVRNGIKAEFYHESDFSQLFRDRKNYELHKEVIKTLNDIKNSKFLLIEGLGNSINSTDLSMICQNFPPLIDQMLKTKIIITTRFLFIPPDKFAKVQNSEKSLYLNAKINEELAWKLSLCLKLLPLEGTETIQQTA